jgi:hypothetical protein
MIEILGSLTFLIVLGVVAIISMIVALEKEKEGVATFILSVALGIVLWQNWYTIVDYVNTNLMESILFSVGYIVVGIIWSFIRWNEKVKEVFRRFNAFKAKFIKENRELTTNQGVFIQELDSKFRSSDGYVIHFTRNDSMEHVFKKITPVGLEYKSLIISWISYWPLSMIGTLLNNPFRRLFEWIYDSVSEFYDRIANRHRNEAFKEFN